MNLLMKKIDCSFLVLAIGLAFSLTACDNDSVSNHAVVVPSGDSDEEDSFSAADYLLELKEKVACGDSLLTDGVYTSRYEYGESHSWESFYYKCENNEWSIVSKESIPDSVEVLNWQHYYSLEQVEQVRLAGEKEWEIVHTYGDAPCNADNEGLVDSVWSGNPKYGYMMYYRCEAGSWVEREQWVTCDTAGVPVGAFCRKKDNVGFFNQLPWTGVYVYEGEGAWMHLLDFRANGDTNVYEGLSKMTKDCSSKNKWDKEKIVYGEETDDITLYYMCADSGWTEIDEAGYHCTTESTDVGDTCSFVSGDSTQHYIFMYTDYYQLRSYYGNIWVKSVVDPELGYCPQVAMEPKYAQKDGKFYYCNYGKWQMAGFVPHQETDSRKEGLTDEEYDILDLPKEASVGDREGGLLEDCYSNDEYDYCMPKNYYQYRDNGTWTKEKSWERATDPRFQSAPVCTAEREGVETVIPPAPNEPGRIYRCVSGYNVIVEYFFGRYEKKD
ncbi:MAG: hypothetical protein J6T62_03535 [Fibrobacter sp.]|nr:hypothetical protein [Fibrobacter sp.]